FVSELGIAPAPALQQLERAILAQDPSLDLERLPALRPESQGAVLVIPSSERTIDGLLSLAEPLARARGKALIVARLVAGERELDDAVAALEARRDTSTDVPIRVAAFTTPDRATDVVRLAASHDVDLVVLAAPDDVDSVPLPDEVAAILQDS